MEHGTNAANDACPLCGFWTCRCNEVLSVVRFTGPADSDPDMDEALRRVRTGR